MKKNILVVDDERSIRELCKEFLEDAGFKVSLAVDGKNAMQKIEFRKFDLYIVDLTMPRMDGLDLLKNILRIQPAAIVIILTGHSSVEDAVGIVQAGAYKYLAKPIQAAELLESVKSGLEFGLSSKSSGTSVKPASTFNLNGIALMLNGFSTIDKKEFLALGKIQRYEQGEMIPVRTKDEASILIVEEGKISVWLENISVDYLHKNDVWGEENFLFSSSVFAKLRADTVVKISRLSRNKILNYFVYKNERLSKRFMINISSSLYFKWRKALQRNILHKLATGSTNF
ncbi:MAG: response regulator [Candidatus Cloacimonadota bacterium]|nr:response regulator [Candidatus Cloacimonadota bacterium]